MNNAIDNIYILYNNPFKLSSLIVKFYEKYQGKQRNDILLSYLILPLILNEDSRTPLLRKGKDLRKFLNFHRKASGSLEEVKKNNKLFGLPERVQEFKEITNHSIQYALNRGCISINEDLSISFIKYDFEEDATLAEYVKAAENLSLMLQKEKLIHVYMRLGIRKL